MGVRGLSSVGQGFGKELSQKRNGLTKQKAQPAGGGNFKKKNSSGERERIISNQERHPLLDWLGTFPESEFGSLELRASLCGDGVGAFLTKPVENGEIVLAVPSEAFLSVSNALQHPVLGECFRKLWKETAEYDPKGSSVLAGLVAHLLLNKKGITTNVEKDSIHDGVSIHNGFRAAENGVYLNMLPQETPAEKHALWWTDDEMNLIRDTSGYQEWVELREDVDEMIGVIVDSGVFSADLKIHGETAVRGAVRAGFVAVLSRAYGVFSSDGREFKALIPLLDALNHATVPNVQYSYEGLASEGGVSGVLVGRAVGSLPKGEELTISYGSHPDHIFGLYFGFVTPPEGYVLKPETKLLVDSLEIGGSDVRQCCKEMAMALSLSDIHKTQVPPCQVSG